MQFENLGLIEPLLRAVRDEGYTEPTAVQTRTIPTILKGQDMLACAQTGTGKTAAFTLPLMQRLSENKPKDGRPIRALVVSPTRELASQIGDSCEVYGKHLDLRHVVVTGGVRQSGQVRKLDKGVDILIATPGRLLDLMNQGKIKLSRCEMFVLDEADRMLDMGFIDDIREVIRHLPKDRQTLMFSATIPRAIQSLAYNILTNAEEVRIDPKAPAADTVEQRVFYVEAKNKQALLEHMLKDDEVTRALVFIRTKRRADRVCRRLKKAGVQAEAIHSDRSQGARKKALDEFKSGKTRVLVASDVASRGLDVDEISHVINFDLPNEPETYIHRIGRTGRAGSIGQAISFCEMEERIYLDDIEKLLNESIEPDDEHPFVSHLPRKEESNEPKKPTTSRRAWRRPMKRRLM
ncbi:MAG: DEAD/DEAH box helicase [Phycisphaerae bacterium]